MSVHLLTDCDHTMDSMSSRDVQSIAMKKQNNCFQYSMNCHKNRDKTQTKAYNRVNCVANVCVFCDCVANEDNYGTNEWIIRFKHN